MTLLAPDPPPAPPNWWYYVVRGGQHVSFYTPAALQQLARQYDRHVSSCNGFHLFTLKPISALKLRLATGPRTSALTSRIRRRKTLIPSDFESISGTPLG